MVALGVKYFHEKINLLTMELWHSIVIGTVAFAYVQLYVRNARQYFESDKTQGIEDVFKW
jgi:hypothetical protein